MFEERQKLFQEVVQVLADVMIPKHMGGQAERSSPMEVQMSPRLGKTKAAPEQAYGPVVLEQLDRLKDCLCAAEETMERLYDKTKLVTYPEPANQVTGCGAEIDQVVPPVAEEIRDAARRVERLIGRMQYLIGRIGL